jgi:hypothetical protein
MITRMRTHLPMVLLAIVLSAGAGIAWAEEDPELPPTPHTQTLADYVRLVDTQLPQFGTAMLAAAPGPDWMSGKTIQDIAAAARNSPPGKVATLGPIVVGYDENDGPRYAKIDFDRGYMRFSDRGRSFGVGTPCGAVPATAAAAIFRSSLDMLGLPLGERAGMRVDTAMERSVQGEEDHLPETTCEIERMVTQVRQHPNGLPIFESWARSSISNEGMTARMLIQWPRFQLADGLGMRTRTQVVNDLAHRIHESEADRNGLGPELELHVRLGYIRTSAGFVPAARAGWSHLLDTEAGEIEYMPLASNPTSDQTPFVAGPATELRCLYDPLGQSALLEFELPKPEHVRLTVVDAVGRIVKVILDEDRAAGWHRLEWNLRDRGDQRVPSGVYFARLQAGPESPTAKILVIR